MGDLIKQTPLPIACPSCTGSLSVCELACPQCNTQIRGHYPLPPFLRLSAEDQSFINDFVLSSGSLKALAKTLRVSYPTVRNRLDDVMARLQSEIQVGSDRVNPNETELNSDHTVRANLPPRSE